jgi:hypothetical protein
MLYSILIYDSIFDVQVREYKIYSMGGRDVLPVRLASVGELE